MYLCRIAAVCASLLLTSGVCFSAAPPSPATPKLVVGIIIDQFRYDYLTRFRSDYQGGIHQLMTKGANFTNADYAQVPTVTAVGHSIFMSGAMPSVSGIIGNSWYDRDESKVVTSVCDWDERTVGGHEESRGQKCTDADPASPRRLLVSTIGDELRNAHPESKVIGISIKARGAILPSGHRAAGAYWFDGVTGHFVTSTFYMNELPSWAVDFNHSNLPAKYVSRKWDGFPQWDFHSKPGGNEPYEKLPASPWGNELIEQFAEQALIGEKLGQGSSTDMLTVSFSSNDAVGHAVGPDAPEVRDMAIRTDRLLAKLFQVIDERVGLKNTIVVLSADHGVASLPKIDLANKMPGGYLHGDVEGTVLSALNKQFGEAKWLIPGAGETSLYFDRRVVANAKSADGKPVNMAEVYRVAKDAILSTPALHVVRVYTREQLDNGISGDFIARAEINGYFPRRSGDLALVYEPGYVPGSHGTSHFSPYRYDRHVPVLFMGPGIKAGHYDAEIQPNDIAATLATMLNLQTPSGSSGQVLTQMLEQ
jgi:hypothetical protein